MNILIDEAYLCQESIRESGSIFSGKEALSEEEFLKVLMGNDRWISFRNDDHPEFKKLRNQLEADGFIHTERRWWNGDRVLKRFKINGYVFEEGDQFPCGAAIRNYIEFNQKDNELS
jgi:hypothetical protein